MVKQLVLVAIAAFVGIALPSQASDDPTAPLGWVKPAEVAVATKPKRPPLPKVQSIICHEMSPCQAVLSGKVAQRGDTVNGYRVSRIEPEHVVLARGNQQWTLSMFTLDIKQ